MDPAILLRPHWPLQRMPRMETPSPSPPPSPCESRHWFHIWSMWSKGDNSIVGLYSRGLFVRRVRVIETTRRWTTDGHHFGRISTCRISLQITAGSVQRCQVLSAGNPTGLSVPWRRCLCNVYCITAEMAFTPRLSKSFWFCTVSLQAGHSLQLWDWCWGLQPGEMERITECVT